MNETYQIEKNLLKIIYEDATPEEIEITYKYLQLEKHKKEKEAFLLRALKRNYEKDKEFLRIKYQRRIKQSGDDPIIGKHYNDCYSKADKKLLAKYLSDRKLIERR